MKNMITALAIAGALVGLFLVAITIFPGATELPDVADVASPPPADPVEGGGDEPDDKPPLPPPAGALTVTGSVKTAAGQPIEGAEIVAFIIESQSVPPRLAKSAKSAAAGTFTLDALAAGKYRFSARMVGFKESTIERVLFAADVQPPLDFVLEAGAVIAGHVLDVEGKPVRGAAVRAYTERISRDANLEERLKELPKIMDMRSEKGVEAKSDESGFYQISGLHAGSYRLITTAKGFAPGTLRFIPVGKTDANFALEIGGVLHGTVTDSTLAPIGDALLEVKEAPKTDDLIEVVLQHEMPPLVSAKTDSAGRFRFDELGGSGEYKLHVGARGFQTREIEKVVVHKGGQHDLPIQLAKGLTISGIVYGPDGRTVEGAKIKATITGQQMRSAELAMSNAASDASGRFAFDTLPEGEFRVVASHDDYASWSENRVKPSDETQLEIRLAEGATVTGQIRDAGTGKGIPGAIAAAQDIGDSDKRAVANGDGVYVLRGVTVPKKGGAATFTYEAEGYSRLSNVKVDVVDRQTTYDQNAELEKNGSVAGVVLDSAGKPLPGVKVTVKRQNTPTMPVIVNVGSTTTSSATGEFTVTDVRPGEGGYVAGTHPKYLESTSEPFDVASGQAVKGVKLIMNLGGSVTGAVIGSDTGQPIVGATVAVRDEALSEEDPGSLPKRALTDKDGRFTIGSLQAGTHTLIASAPGYLRGEQPGIAVEEERTSDAGSLSLVPSAYVAGRVIQVNGDPIPGAKITVIDNSSGYKKHNATTNSNGEFRVADLGQAPVTVEASAKGYAKQIIPDVPVDNDTLEITLERLGAIHGFVVDDQGAPLAAFSVQPRINRYGHSAKAAPAKTFQMPDGSYTFDDLEAGNYEIGVGAMGYSYERLGGIQVQPEQTTEVRTIVLTRGGKIAGWVTDRVTGEPLERASVSIIGGTKELIDGESEIKGAQGRSSTTTDVQGYFELTGIGRTNVSVKVRKEGYVEEVKKVASGNSELQVALEPGGSLQGYVYAADGSPMPGQTLLLTGQSGYNESGVSDRNGRYFFRSLKEGNYSIRLSSLGMSEGMFGSPGEPSEMDERRLQEYMEHLRRGGGGTSGALQGDRKEMERRREDMEKMKEMTPEEREEYMRERSEERQSGGSREDSGPRREGGEFNEEKFRRGMNPEEKERYDGMTAEQKQQYQEGKMREFEASSSRAREARAAREDERSNKSNKRSARGPLVGSQVFQVTVYAGVLNEFDLNVEE